MRTVTWRDGERNRGLRTGRPCPCGCEDYLGVGYLTVSDEHGCGVTFWAESELEFAHMLLVAEEEGLFGRPLSASEGWCQERFNGEVAAGKEAR